MTTTGTSALHDSTKAYTRPALRLYDTIIMGLLARWVWRCPSPQFTQLYDALVSTNHLEIGVGTGYCLDRCRARIRRLALVDLNPNCVEYARRRLQRYSPSVHIRNALEPVHINDGPFDSIAIGGVLHCLPGTMKDKGRVFDNLRPVLNRNTIAFGYTLISDEGALSLAGFAARALLNRVRFVNNYSDTSDELRKELQKRFDKAVVTRVGALAFFIATQFSNKGGEIS